MVKDEVVWDTAECADFLRITKTRLDKSRVKHLGVDGPPYFKMGHLVRYRRSDVLRWLSEQAALDITAPNT